MSTEVVPSKFECEITPSDISLDMLPLVIGELSKEIEIIPFMVYLVVISQKAGKWAGAIWDSKVSAPYSILVETKLVSEFKMEGVVFRGHQTTHVWVYELSHPCIIAIHQKQRELLEDGVTVRKACPVINLLERLQVAEFAHA